MLEAVVGEVLEDVKSLAGGNIPVPLLLDFREKPGLDECPSAAKKKRKGVVIPITDDPEGLRHFLAMISQQIRF